MFQYGVGRAIVLRRRASLTLGGFFLYDEEISVAEICRGLGLSVLHEPDLTVQHEENQTFGRVLTRSAYRWQKEARADFIDKYLRDTA
jgi:hypothetical protein